MQSLGYLYDSNCRKHKDYSVCKSFLNRWVPDEELSLSDSCYYLNNYNHLEVRGQHRYARPSYAFKFLIKKNMKHFHKNEMEYCYHGTRAELLKKILHEGLRIPDGKEVKVRNGSAYGNGIYSTKIPEYAQLYAEPYQCKGKYFQVMLLLRQDFKKLKCTGAQDVYGTFSKPVKDEYGSIKNIHLLHKNLMSETDIQWMTEDDKSIVIEAVIVKVHDLHPQKGEFREIARLIEQRMKA